MGKTKQLSVDNIDYCFNDKHFLGSDFPYRSKYNLIDLYNSYTYRKNHEIIYNLPIVCKYCSANYATFYSGTRVEKNLDLLLREVAYSRHPLPNGIYLAHKGLCRRCDTGFGPDEILLAAKLFYIRNKITPSLLELLLTLCHVLLHKQKGFQSASISSEIINATVFV